MDQKIPVPGSNGAYKKRYFLPKILLIIAVSFIAIAGIALWIANESLPEGVENAIADSLAREMMAAVNVEKWQQTGAISWTFAGRHAHLWDRERHLAQVVWGSTVVLVDLNSQSGVAIVDGKLLDRNDPETMELVQKAWEYWCNDSFWLNPIAKLFDDGTTRKWVETPDSLRGLLITYASGGATPGDSYMWLVGENGLPVAWKLWVSILPIGGIQLSWEGWQELATGATVATIHRNGMFELKLSDIRAAATLNELVPGEDPFTPLFQ